jgi:HlyD family secretion protein
MARSRYFRPGPTVLVLLIAAIVAAALYLSIRKPPYQVDLAPVTRGPLTVTIDDEGETRVHDLYVVSAPINGRVLRIELEAGDPVVAGETVVRALDDVVASSASRVAQARAARTLALQEQGRINALFKRGFATRASLDRANAAVAEANAGLSQASRSAEAASHDRDAARANLMTPRGGSAPGKVLAVRSPVSGTVMRLPRESETTVLAGAPLIELGNPRDLEIVTDLLSADAVRIKPGASVRIENWGEAKPLKAKVRRIEPYGFTKISALGVEEQRVNVIIDITDPPAVWGRLGHGYRVIVRIAEWESPDSLQLPVSALFREKGAWAVFAVEGGKARLMPVQVGRMNNETAEVLGGIAKGAEVILHPSEKITDGARVARRR